MKKVTSNYEETIKRAAKYYKSGDSFDKSNLINIYEELTEQEQQKADIEIIRFLPSWTI